MKNEEVHSMLKIVAPTRYPWTFNGPRASRHSIRRCRFVPFNRVSSRFDGFTLFPPSETSRCHLIHAFNRIPLGRREFVIGFESHLPRMFGGIPAALERHLWTSLVSERCRSITAISEFARDTFVEQLQSARLSGGQQDALLKKLTLRYPNLIVPASEDLKLEHLPMEPFRLLFVGNHFARKGGCVVLKMAELALRSELPFRFTIVSDLQCGREIWSDPTLPGCYDRYLELLTLENVDHHMGLPNAEVMDLLKNAHMGILPTFSDTFGYSVIEALSLGKPVLVTRQGALPEIVNDGCGLIVEGAKAPGRSDWTWPFDRRDDADFVAAFHSEVHRIAVEALEKLSNLVSSPELYSAMAQKAYDRAKGLFDADDASKYWDETYEKLYAA